MLLSPSQQNIESFSAIFLFRINIYDFKMPMKRKERWKKNRWLKINCFYSCSVRCRCLARSDIFLQPWNSLCFSIISLKPHILPHSKWNECLKLCVRVSQNKEGTESCVWKEFSPPTPMLWSHRMFGFRQRKLTRYTWGEPKLKHINLDNNLLCSAHVLQHGKKYLSSFPSCSYVRESKSNLRFIFHVFVYFT